MRHAKKGVAAKFMIFIFTPFGASSRP